MPSGLFVDFGAQPERTSGGVSRRIGFQNGVKVDEIRPDQHPLSLAEIVPVSNGFLHRLTAIGRQVGKPAQALRNTHQLSGNRLCVVPRHTENARLNFQLRLRRKQRFHPRFFTVGRDATDNIGGGFRFGFTLRHAHNNRHGF